MGTVYAKDQSSQNFDINVQKKHTANFNNVHRHDMFRKSEPRQINVNGVRARVDNVHIDGLMRTKDDIVIDSVQDLFQAQDFTDVIKLSSKVRQNLESLGCFKSITVQIDTSTGPRSTPDGLDVTFHVKEQRRLGGGISTSIGNNSEANLILGLKAPNLLGRGERVQLECSYGSRRTNNLNVAFIKPIRGRWNSIFTTSVFQNMTEWPWSGYKLLDRGVGIDLQFSSAPFVKHNIQWEGVIRDLSVLSRTTSFAVREQSGPNLKSSIRHILSVDHRDEKIFPTSGSLFQLTTEFAGLGGNVGFVKNDALFQTNYSLFDNVVLQSSIQGGFLRGLVDKNIGLSDQFYLGGPLNLRGFSTRGVGPRSDGNSLGSNIFWAGAVHLYTPLPFNPGKGGFGDHFRTHFFVNGGNIGNFNFTDDYQQNLKLLAQNIRIAYGFGIALRIGNAARLELNYCIPYSYRKGDEINNGVQVGIGVHFL